MRIFALLILLSVNVCASDWPLRQIAKKTNFTPRDSSVNMIAKYKSEIFIFGGWSNFGHDDWHSFVDVWTSSDGVDWKRINNTPPYAKYSKFVVFGDKIFAIGSDVWSTTDGVSWNLESSNGKGFSSTRVVVLKNLLYAINGNSVVVSQNAKEWFEISTAPWSKNRRRQHMVAFKNKLWVFGGDENYGTDKLSLYNDVWSSADGFLWKQVIKNASWEPRIWGSEIVYDDKIFLFNGWNKSLNEKYAGNFSDIWMSSNGIDWVKLISPIKVQNRHASFITLSDKGNILLSSGYGGRGLETIYNDVWEFAGRVYFSKESGDLSNLKTWGREIDGNGVSPNSFDLKNQIFVLNNRDVYEFDPFFSISGTGSYVYVNESESRKQTVVIDKGLPFTMCKPKFANFDKVARKINLASCE